MKSAGSKKPKAQSSKSAAVRNASFSYLFVILFIIIGVTTAIYYPSIIQYYNQHFHSEERDSGEVDAKIVDKTIQEIRRNVKYLVEKQLPQYSAFISSKTGSDIQNLEQELNQLSSILSSQASKTELRDLISRVDSLKKEIERKLNSQPELNNLANQLKTIRTNLSTLSDLHSSLLDTVSQHNKISGRIREAEERLRVAEERGSKSTDFLSESQFASDKGSINSEIDGIDVQMRALEDIIEDLERKYHHRDNIRAIVETTIEKNRKVGVTSDEVGKIIKQNLENVKDFLPRWKIEEITKRIVEKYLPELSFDQREEIKKEIIEDLEKRIYKDEIEFQFNLPDEALESKGSKITDFTGFFNFHRVAGHILPNLDFSSPNVIIQNHRKQPGHCWPFHGSSAFIHISLHSIISPDSISIFHIPSDIAIHIQSAPRVFHVTGTKPNGLTMDLGEFTYDINSSPAQNFKFKGITAEDRISGLRVDFLSNYGGPYTCIYRIAVHGTPITIRGVGNN